MDTINQLLEFDFVKWFYTGFIIVSGFVTVATMLAKFMSFIGKPIKWFQNTNKDHELLIKVNSELSRLTDKQLNDVAQSIAHDERLGDQLSEFMLDIRTSVSEIKKEQTGIAELMDNIIVSNKARDTAIMEEMCDRIGQKTRHYIEIGGIPEDEYDDFIRLFAAYKGIGGNHGAEAKVNYCINNLPIFPVNRNVSQETKQ